MTDEEKAIEYCGCNQPICRKGFETNGKQNCSCARKKYYLEGLAEGRKEGYEQGKNNERELQCGKKNYEGDISKLEKENAELNRDKTELVNSVTELKSKVAELEKENKEILEDNDTLNKWIDDLKAQNEKMKNCHNCKHSFHNGGYEEKCSGCWKYESKEDFQINKKTYLHWELAE